MLQSSKTCFLVSIIPEPGITSQQLWSNEELSYKTRMTQSFTWEIHRSIGGSLALEIEFPPPVMLGVAMEAPQSSSSMSAAASVRSDR
jgi:hypothetical protein